jgi:hypothetical protein
MNIREMTDFRNVLRNNPQVSNKIIIEKYLEFCRSNADFRSICQGNNKLKTFAVKGRKGEHQGSDSNREEEKICKAIYNSYSENNIGLQGFGQIVVDYQTPLKNSCGDERWGKIDLVGLIKNSSNKELCFWEVKIDNQDSIKYAIVELLIYLSQFDFINSRYKKLARQNYYNYIRELYLSRNISVHNNIIIFRDKLPILFIAGDEKYFRKQNFDNDKNNIKNLIKEIKKKTDIIIRIINITGKKKYDRNQKKYFFNNGGFKVLL